MTSKTQTPDSLAAPEPLFAASATDDLSSHRYRMFIGLLGLMMPVLLWVIAGLRPIEGFQRWELLSSVSAYYYSGAVVVFVGILVALGIFLVTYRGYDNEYNWLDRLAGAIAGVAAIGVAFFPTEAPPGMAKLPWWTPQTGAIHLICAVALFGAFIFFSAFLFPKSDVEKGETLPSSKRIRNFLYRLCGGAMLVCMALIFIIKKYTEKSIFWPEAIALEFFALSWLLKGRADWTLARAGRRTLHYGRHPGQLAGKVWKSIRR
jgi:hypothetical protein